LEERRASRRYKLALQIEIRLESDLKEFEPILGRTRDISTHGLYFRIGQGLSVGMKIGFSIMPPWEETTHAFITGWARVVRVEEVSESSVDHLGVGAVIETYKFGQAESSGEWPTLLCSSFS
jgi:c-di-GMP-binding flagellar brake protein YcgR